MKIDHLPIGRYADGDPVCISLREMNCLMNGNPRSGKSVCLSAIVCQLMRCNNEAIYILSPKILDFANFAGRCELVQDPRKMLSFLGWLQHENERRKQFCIANDMKKLTEFNNEYPHVTVVIDEYTVIKMNQDHGKEIENQVMKLVAETGFAGFSFIIATQRASSKNMSTDLRDLITGVRVCFACSTEESTKMVFDCDYRIALAHKIPSSAKGVGYISVAGQQPKLFKSAFVSQQDEKRITNQTLELKPQMV